MAANGVASRLWMSEKMDGLDFRSSPVNDEEVHVLAVDDSLVDRKVIERLLKISSCKVTAVDSGRRALQFLGLDEEKSSSIGFDGLKVDLIITDYCMPGMTGYELLKRIKESTTLREIPVVIMSSENVVTRIDRCLEEGAEDFIVKPVKLADVKRIKDYMTSKEVRVKNELESSNNININKRKSRGSCDDLSSPASSPPSDSPSPTSTLSLSPRSSTSSSPTSLSPSPSMVMSSSSSSEPCSPSSLDSPTRRLKMMTSE